MSTVETDADVERTWDAALSNEHIKNSFYTLSSMDKSASYGSDADVMK